MPVHVNEVTTEISAEDRTRSNGDFDHARETTRWRALDRLRTARARLEAEEARTRAKGFHD